MKPLVTVLSLVLLIAIPAIVQANVAQPPSTGFTPEGGGAANAWWTDRQAGLVGGIAGSVVGILGGLIGSLVGHGKARRLALGLTAMLTFFGVACLIVGLMTVAMSQPFTVYYPLLLMGLLCTVIFGVNYRVVRMGYAMRELRKMEALDLKEGCRP
jgi:hypothetical protein